MAIDTSVENLRKLNLDQLQAIFNVPGLDKKAYEQVLNEKMSNGGRGTPLPVGDNKRRNEALASGMALLGMSPASVPADVKAANAKAGGQQLYDESQGGPVAPASVHQDAAAVEAGQKVAGGKGKLEEYKGFILSSNMPDWIKAQTQGAAGVYGNEEKQRVVDEYNKLVPPSERITKFGTQTQWDDFILANQQPSEEAKAAFMFAGLGPAESSHTFQLPGGGEATVRESELSAFTQGGAWEPAKIASIQDAINIASTLGMKNEGTGHLEWQILYAFDRLGRGALKQEEAPRRSDGARGPAGHQRGTGPGTSVSDDASKYGPGGKVDPRLPGHRGDAIAPDTGYVLTTADFVRAGQLGAIERGRYKNGIDFQQAMKETGGDHAMAYLKVVNPDVYNHVVKDGKINPESRVWADAAAQIFGESGFDKLDQLGMYSTGSMADLTNYIDRSGSGNTGSSILLPDPLKVDQSMKDLYNAWFGMDPTTAEYTAFRDDLFAKMRGALPGVGQRVNQDVDPAAQLRNTAENSPQYAALFANKPAGISADDYVNSNRQAVGSILGNDMSAGAVRAGQLTGKTQTAVGAAAGEKSALENSTFMERLARAAQAASAAT